MAVQAEPLDEVPTPRHPDIPFALCGMGQEDPGSKLFPFRGLVELRRHGREFLVYMIGMS